MSTSMEEKPLRVLICGDRHWRNREKIRKAIACLPTNAIIIHGAATGADTIGGEEANGRTVEAYPADWRKYGRAAGPIRNQQMLDTGIDLVLAFHPDLSKSKGTADMVKRATAKGVTVKVVS